MVTTSSAAGIVFWVVVRDKTTKKIISTKQFTTHDEAVHYHISTDDPDPAARNGEVSVEILATGKVPKE
jgi:hypothetical protein